jgi:hypothetical protein
MMTITFKKINQWHLIFLGLLALNITLSWIREGNPLANWEGLIMVWTLYQIGRFSLDREFEIKLETAIEESKNK